MTKRTTFVAGAALILIAISFTGAVALFVIPGVQMLPQYRLGAEDILPATETIFLLSDPSTETVQRWKTIFPALDDVTSDAPLEAVAIIRTEGTTRSVGFLKKSGAWDGKSCDIGPYQLVFGTSEPTPPCPTIQELDQFLSRGPRLSRDHGWKALGRLPDAPWAFVRDIGALTEEKTMQQRILHGMVIGDATHLLTWKEGEHVAVRSWSASPLSPLPELSALSTPTEHPETVFAFGSLDGVLAQLDHALSPDDHGILEGLLLQKLEDLAGPHVSLRYELLPLLALNTEIHMGKTASGADVVLLSGYAQKTTDTALRIEALHRSFALRHPDVELLEYGFDDGRFPFRTLRIAEDASKETSEQIRGWAVTISRDAVDGAMLITAINGKQTAISNDPEVLRRFLMEEGSIIPLPTTKRPIASRLVAAMLVPNGWLGNGPLWMTGTGKSVVSVEQNGEVRTVRVR